ncbi:ATP-binding cassette domain-containing protein [Actinomadura sp. NPDC000600]|uniref:branched-chain amino acid ABC transporter ATP-binding protein n=1 Tax=Actinomadura sp. NPDC000600 TaxID=3154262 RepID=UPI003393C127
MRTEPRLRVSAFSAGYLADVPIVNELTHGFANGSVTTIVGPNGAGKSSLLNGIYGLTQWSTGSVRIGDLEVRRMPAWKRLKAGISLVPQGRCNFPQMTVLENLRLGAYTLPRNERSAAVAEALDEFPALATCRTRAAGNLSGGQQQLLEIAMAMVVRPQALLIDEPSLGLSPKARCQVFDKLQEIAAGGVSVVMVEQNVVEGLAASDVAVVMTDGRIHRNGPAGEILNDPEMKNVFLGGRPAAAGIRSRSAGDPR